MAYVIHTPGVARRVSCPTLIGRTAELGRLDAALAQAQSGSSVLLFVSGDAGIGKSRLVETFADRARSETRSSSPAPASTWPKAPRRTPRSSPRCGRWPTSSTATSSPTSSARHSASSARCCPSCAAARRTPATAPSADGSTSWPSGCSGAWPRSIPPSSSWRTCTGSTRPPPTCWRCSASNLRRAGLVIIGTYRSDEVARDHPLHGTVLELERSGRAERIELTGLSGDEVTAQVTGILGTEPATRQTRSLFDRSEGNPFFVEELLGGRADEHRAHRQPARRPADPRRTPRPGDAVGAARRGHHRPRRRRGADRHRHRPAAGRAGVRAARGGRAPAARRLRRRVRHPARAAADVAPRRPASRRSATASTWRSPRRWRARTSRPSRPATGTPPGTGRARSAASWRPPPPPSRRTPGPSRSRTTSAPSACGRRLPTPRRAAGSPTRSCWRAAAEAAMAEGETDRAVELTKARDGRGWTGRCSAARGGPAHPDGPDPLGGRRRGGRLPRRTRRRSRCCRPRPRPASAPRYAPCRGTPSCCRAATPTRSAAAARPSPSRSRSARATWRATPATRSASA